MRLARGLLRAARWCAVRAAPDAVLARLAPGGPLELAGGGGADDDRWTGAVGEELAARALARAGMEVLGRNVGAAEGEIDVLARDGEALVAVEVKCGRFGGAAEPVWRPLDRVRVDSIAARCRAAARIAARVGAAASRVDLVEVRLGERPPFRVEHFRGVAPARPFPWERGPGDVAGRRLPP